MPTTGSEQFGEFFHSQRPLVLDLYLIEYCFLDKDLPRSNNHSIINGSEHRDNISYLGYRCLPYEGADQFR